jgi:hypothetical protein
MEIFKEIEKVKEDEVIEGINDFERVPKEPKITKKLAV